MLLGPAIEVKAIKGDALGADRDLSERGAHLGVEPVAVHAEVGGCIAQPDQAGRKLHPGGPVPVNERPEPKPRWRGREAGEFEGPSPHPRPTVH